MSGSVHAALEQQNAGAAVQRLRPDKLAGGEVRHRLRVPLLSDPDYADLQIIRKIRNEFAHAEDVLGFEKPGIEALVSRMKKPKTKFESACGWYFARISEIGNDLIDQTARVAGDAGGRAASVRPASAQKPRGASAHLAREKRSTPLVAGSGIQVLGRC
jgi:hypothetical protein